MTAITGRDTQDITPTSYSDTELLTKIRGALEARHPVTACTPAKDDVGKKKMVEAKDDDVYWNHAYTVMAVEGDKVRLRNPWGSRHPALLDAGKFKKYYARIQINGL